MAGFACATLVPVALTGAGLIWGGAWLWAAALYMGVLVILIDQILPYVAGDAPEGAEFPAGDALLTGLALSHLALLPMAVWAIAGPSGLNGAERVLAFVAAGYWMGQVAHPAAHELIHRGNRALYGLGVAIYTTLLIGHHASAHRLVHHRTVATPEDPASAPAGMGFWRFAPRHWIGSFRAGWAAENALRARGRRRLHPYHLYVGGAVGSVLFGALLAGWAGSLIWVALASHAQLQMSLADYVQHYGLRRRALTEGRYEPVADRHSWNTPHWFSAALMLNAPRHSDHHAHPSRPYPALRLPAEAPMLPWPLPLACTLALWPGLWKRRMRPLVEKWAE